MGELTSRERDIWKNLRENGRNGYFYKGKLHIKPVNTRNNSTQGARYVVNARHMRPQHTEQTMDTSDNINSNADNNRSQNP